jgi:hypothetical protein
MRYLFAGPSLPDAATVAPPGWRVLPPIAAGDLLRLSPGADDAVGIVDGYFHQTRAITHKEIMAVLARGVPVLGAASMGALRAAELHRWGMVGVGGIADAYRRGELTADDEVTLVHGPADEGYVRLSEPLVNIRATLSAAVGNGVCDAPTAAAIVELCAAMPYRHRRYHRIRELATEAGADASQARRLQEYCLAHPVDRKRADALELVAALADARTGGPGRPYHRTIYIHSWLLRQSAGAALRALRLCQVLAADYPVLHRATVLAAICADCRRHCGRGDADPVAHGAHRGWYPEAPGRGDIGFLSAWTTATERSDLDVDELLTRFLVRSYRIKPGIVDTTAALVAFQAHPGYRRATRIAERVASVNALAARHRPGFRAGAIASNDVLQWLADRWGWPVDDLELAAFDRGFSSVDGLLAVARDAYLTGRFDRDAKGFTLSGD